jgi:beta-phosphoglucomutase-like phosphatase (HAD superfamily)
VTRYFENARLHALLSAARLVIFDMNGLIVDDERLQLEAVNAALERVVAGLGKGVVPPVDEEYWKRHCLGLRTDRFLASVLSDNGFPADGVTIERIMSAKNEFYGAKAKTTIRALVRPGVVQLLDHIAAGVEQAAALATSALPEEIESILGESGLDLKGRFGFVASGADVSNAKPDPEIFLMLSRGSGVGTAECLVLEDSATGVRAAANAGMPCIACPNAFTLFHDFGTAACVVDSLRRDAIIISP